MNNNMQLSDIVELYCFEMYKEEHKETGDKLYGYLPKSMSIRFGVVSFIKPFF